jgi:hypothetical protein
VTGLSDLGDRRVPGVPRTRTVATIPAGITERYTELWRALEEAYPVRFVHRRTGELESVDAAIVFPGERAPERFPGPCLELDAEPPHRPGSTLRVDMGRSDALDRTLRGQVLAEHDRGRPAPVRVADGWRVLATADGRPVWARRAGTAGAEREVAAAVPAELGDHEYLRDHLTAGRFWSLLPLVHFLKRITRGISPRSAPLQACIVIDDPNVRWPSYGYVKFADLANDARDCGYHVAVATIPLDLVMPGHRAVGVFRELSAHLSLVVHGNDHVHRELDRPHSAGEADRMIHSATTRVARFERRVGIRVERVMCPPHGACGAYTLGALFRHGFLGLAASRPFPWDAFADQRHWRLGGWLPAQLAGGGLPVVPRCSLDRDLDDLVFRAFLEQPLIVYCHHADVRDGFDRFRAVAARAAPLGDISWRSLASITRRNAVWSESDGAVTVRLYSRDLRLPGLRAEAVRIEVPRIFGGGGPPRLVVNGVSQNVQSDGHGRFSLEVAVRPEAPDLHVRIATPRSAPAPARRDWLPGAWPLARRALTESRDRALPLVATPGR